MALKYYKVDSYARAVVYICKQVASFHSELTSLYKHIIFIFFMQLYKLFLVYS